MKRFLLILATVLLPYLHCLALDSVTINGLNYILDSSDQSAIVSTQSTSLSGAITIPASVTYSGTSYSVKELVNNAFYDCDGISSVTIPSSITALSNYCFYDCDYLTSVIIPTSVTSIGDKCFYNCDRLSSISIPSSVNTLGNSCFVNTPIQTITIPSSVTSIGSSCFYYCTNLTNATINANVTSLPSNCFQNCYSLTSVSIPNSVTSLQHECFSGCLKLSSITLPSGLKTLDYGCFGGCSSLTEIVLPASVTSISNKCFSSTGLSKLTCNATMPPYVHSTAFTATLYQHGTLLVPSSAVSAYQAAATWKDWKYVKAIGSPVEAIANVTINGLNFLLDSGDHTAIVSTQSTSLSGAITIPASVTYSGTSYSVKELVNRAFYDCDGISSVTIPSSITTLSNDCFYDCDYLTSVIIPTSVTSIGDECFSNCDRLASISIPSSVNTLGERCFANTPIQTISIPSSVTHIGNACFSGCKKLTNATINANITSLLSYCFRNCYSLTSVSIPNSVTNLQHECFSGCSKLSSVTLPNELKTLDWNCFEGCSSLTEITLPASVTNISTQCFYNCTELSKLTCNATTPPTVSSDAFESTLCQCGTLLVPSSSISAYQAAATWKDWKYVKAIGSPVEAITNATINGLNFLLDSGDHTAIVSTQSTSLSGAITIPASVTYSGTSYSVKGFVNKAFYDCDGISSVTIPSSISALSNYCFFDCDNLTSVTVPSSVTSIGDNCFSNCDRLASISIPSSVNTLGKYCFAKTPIQTIIIPSSVTHIGNACFSGCKKLTNATINANITSLLSYCFQNCYSLTSVSIPNSVTNLQHECFSGCSKLSSVTLPNELKTLDWNCFEGCSSLTEITLPASVTNISTQCFYNCTELSKLTCNATTPPSVSSNAFESTLYQYGTLLVPLTAISAYQAATTWKDWGNIQPLVIAESVAIDNKSLILQTGESATLTATVLPENATNKDVTWTSSDTSVATVDETGLVTAIAPGSAIITASTTDGSNLSATCEVNVISDTPEDISSTDISQMTDVLYSTEMTSKSGGQIVLPIYMKNSAAVTLFQTNVYLPEGFSFAKKTTGKYAVSMIKDRITDEDDNHVISANLQQDGSLLILCSSQDNYTFDGNDGKVATVTIDVADDVVEGKYLIKMNNQKMVRPNNTGSNVAEYQVVATIKNFTLGDVNDDGDIDGYDLVGISNLILGTNTEGLNRDAADVNQDTEIDGYDYVMEVNTILGTNAATAKNLVKAAAVESELPVLNLSSMAVSAGEQAEMNVGLECYGDVFTLVQTDIEFPAGIEPVLRNGRVVVKLADECRDIDDDHAISCVKQSNGKYRVLVMSQSNTGFNGSNGKLFTINVETASDIYPGMYDVTLSNTKLVRANNTGVNPSDCTAAIICNGTTGISDIDAEQTENVMYNLNGQRVSKYAQRGIYISNGKKNVKK